jgi:hypothetical protein
LGAFGAGRSSTALSARFTGRGSGSLNRCECKARALRAALDAQHTELAVQIGFAARFDLDELEAKTLRFFVDDEATLGDPFAEDAHLRTIHTKALQEMGFFLVPASRTWDRWISFSSELFRRVVATRGDMPAQAVRTERQRLWTPPEGPLSALRSIQFKPNSMSARTARPSARIRMRGTATIRKKPVPCWPA